MWDDNVDILNWRACYSFNQISLQVIMTLSCLRLYDEKKKQKNWINAKLIYKFL